MEMKMNPIEFILTVALSLFSFITVGALVAMLFI
jgi:hypothetical protein